VSSFSVIRETFSNRNVTVLTITQTLFMFTAFLWWPYRSLFILELGATKELLGMLLMLETVSRLMFQLPGGVMADRLGRRKLIVLSSVIRLGSPLVLLFATHWTHVAPGIVLNAASSLGMPAVNALIAESLPEGRRGSGFAAYRMVTWMPMIVTSLIGGMLMDYYGVVKGVRIVLVMTLACSVLSTLLRWRFITETLGDAENEERTRAETPLRRGSLQELGRMPRGVWVMTAVAAISMFGQRAVMSFMVIYAVEEVGLTKTEWGAIGTVVSLITTLLTMPGGMLADRIGRKPCILISRVLSSFSTLGFTFSQNFWHLGAARVVGGVAQGFGGTAWGPMGGPVWQALVADLTPPEDRGRMMGMMGTIQGLVTTPASWVGGYMYDNISPELPFYTSFALNTIGTLIFLALLREPERSRPKE
jgi:MFS family permease